MADEKTTGEVGVKEMGQIPGLKLDLSTWSFHLGGGRCLHLGMLVWN